MENNQIKSFQYAQASDVGCVRELNEDSLFCGEGLWLVADGMGGHACGEVASALAAKTVAESYERQNDLALAIKQAHLEILKAASHDVGQVGMGTTVVALASDEHCYQVAWVGDSRAYLWDKKSEKLTQMSEDHSLVVRLVKSGLLSAKDAEHHPQRHMITQCLGSAEIEDVVVDTIDEKWLPEQQILLCSDGLSDDVTESQISDILKRDLSNEQKLANLIRLAKQTGGKDNISVILVDSPVKSSLSLWQKILSYFK